MESQAARRRPVMVSPTSGATAGPDDSTSEGFASPQVSIHQEDVTRPVTLVIINNSDSAVLAFWSDYDGKEHLYGTVQPGDRHHQSTFNTHAWNLRAQDGRLLATYRGDGASITLRTDSSPQIEPCETPKVVWSHEEWGEYKWRGEAVGIPVMAFDCVSDDAIVQAEHIMKQMLMCTPEHIIRRMQESRADVAIIGCGQVTTDIPAHQYLKGSKTADGRCFDEACRGLGGTSSIPTTSCAEENCTMVNDRRYASESILVHEFAHAVMNLGVTEDTRNEIEQAYRKAREEALYAHGCYMMANADEYWAEAVQSWFCATARCDVNSGVYNRQLLEEHDPRLASILQATFGENNHWRFSDDCPGTLKPYKGSNPGLPPSDNRDLTNTDDEPLGTTVTIGGAKPRGSIRVLQRSFVCIVSAFGGASCCGLTVGRQSTPDMLGKTL